jgi:phosphoglycerate kinase
VRGYLEDARRRGVDLVLRGHTGAAEAFAAAAPHDVVRADAIPADRLGLDIGPRSAELFATKLADAQTIFWNGPMGVFELEPYAHGTRAVAQALVDSSAFTVVGGGDSAAAVRTLGFHEGAFGHISTGGGASLEYLEGATLPGLTVLD